jgi:uncharacterized protein (TIGR00255 family)
MDVVNLLRSMTGFGHSVCQAGGCKIQVDMRSVNHRYLDIAVRMPREWNALEDTVKQIVTRAVRRGRVEVVVTISRESAAAGELAVDWTLVETYIQACEQICARYGLHGRPDARDLLLIPDVLRFRDSLPEPDEPVKHALEACAEEAAGALKAMRETEGAILREDLLGRLAALESMRMKLAGLYPEALRAHLERLRGRVRQLLQDVSYFDERLFAMETAVLAERSDIAEELTRLASHFRQFRETLELDEPVGRKLDFLVQEMNRETNTIGSKSMDASISALVVEMKAELEKVREQVQNIE